MAVLKLYRLIDWLICLPEELEVEFHRELADYEQQQHMPHITTIERLGQQKGRQEGRQEGRHEGRQEGLQQGWRAGLIAARQRAVLDAFEIRFGPVPEGLRQRIETIQDEARLRALLQSAIQTASAESFAQTS